MRLGRFICPRLILLDVSVDSRDDLLRLLAQRLASVCPSLDAQVLEQALREREEIGSTAVGDGVALPHARIPVEGKALVGIARLKNPIDFNAPDRKPVWLAAFSAVDAADPSRHLQILARLTRILHSQTDREALRRAKTVEDMLDILAREDRPGMP